VAGQAGHAVRGAAWLLGGQVTVILAQLFYAAFTGRLVSPAAFGAYAVAMSTAPLVLMLATAGIGSAAARAQELSEPQVRALATVSLGLGVVAAGIVWLIADPWSLLWGNPEAVDATRWSALGILPAPFLGLLVGLSRRSGKFRQLSMASTGGGFIGMTIGAVFVWNFRSAASLVAMSIGATAIQTVLLVWVVGRRARPGPLRFDVVEHLRFGTKVVLSNGIGYLTVAAPQLALSRGVGAAMLGSWNRAAVITQVPLEMIQNSMVQVLYPEFRHDIGTTDRASKLWLDLLALAAWVMLPLGAVTAACAYFMLPFVLGPGWQTAASLAPWVAMTAATNVPVVVLGSALEATGRFGGVWPPRISGLAITASSAAIALAFHSVLAVIVGLLLAAVVSHALQLHYVHRSAIFSVNLLLRVYLKVLLVTGAAGLVTALWLSGISLVEGLALKVLLSGGMVLMAGTMIWFTRLRLPPIRIARRYGLFRGLGQGSDLLK
jgi:O-antigen/teichoic acid export membrane protein